MTKVSSFARYMFQGKIFKQVVNVGLVFFQKCLLQLVWHSIRHRFVSRDNEHVFGFSEFAIVSKQVRFFDFFCEFSRLRDMFCDTKGSSLDITWPKTQ